MGGDFVQVGFIRRNILDALMRFTAVDDVLLEAIELGLQDGYFEVRSAAARCAYHFADHLGAHAPRIEAALDPLIDDPSFEVQIDVIRALGRVAAAASLLPRLERLYFHKIWEVREAVVTAMGDQLARGRATPEEIRAAMEAMLITSNGFVPHFPLKAALRDLAETMAEARGRVPVPTPGPTPAPAAPPSAAQARPAS